MLQQPVGIAALFATAGSGREVGIATTAEVIGDSQKHFSDLLKSLEASREKAKEAKAADRDDDSQIDVKSEDKLNAGSTDRLKSALDIYATNESDPSSGPFVKANAA